MEQTATFANVPFDEIEVGATASVVHRLTRADIELLALVSGDVDPFHVESDRGGEGPGVCQEIEGVAALALIAGVLGSRLPGPGMKILAQEVRSQGSMSTGDVLTATVRVAEKLAAEGQVVLECRCTNESGAELVSGRVWALVPREKRRFSAVVPARLVIRRGDAFVPMFEAASRCAPVSCAVVHPCDRASIQGAIEAAARGYLVPTFVGPVERIRAAASAAGASIDEFPIVDAPHSHASASQAVQLARAGKVESLMKGSLHTDELVEAIVSSAAGLRSERRISHVFVMDVPTYPRPLFISDAAVNIAPSLDEKADIVRNAIDLARALGIEKPKVAILSAVETVRTKIPSTLDAAALCKMADRGQILGGVLDGPLAFDNAVSPEAARIKGIQSPVAGRADVLIVPDLEAGNMLAKQLSYLAGAESAGLLMGARVPVVLTSRADSVRSRLASSAILSLLVHAQEAAP